MRLAFSRRNPDVNFEVHDGITYTLYRYLMDGIIDISIARTPLRLDDVDYKILSSEPMIAVSSKDMLPEKNGSLKLSDLLNIPLIIYRRYEALIMDAFHSRGMEPDLSASATISRRDALGKGRPCHCHFPAVHELSARDSASSRSQKATWKRRSP